MGLNIPHEPTLVALRAANVEGQIIECHHVMDLLYVPQQFNGLTLTVAGRLKILRCALADAFGGDGAARLSRLLIEAPRLG